ncbi:GOLPH3/VPS74 family protein [Plantactinospora sonchi]|uniref:GPP34 family phosphoprotein n=1 Tax=Plantactinospora sonchi TaxID=1544735 RepID=A0ABU7RU05_9ACTN
MTNVSLAEVIALLAHDVDGVARGTGTHLDYGLSGAQLMDLALAGRIDVVGNRVAVINPAATGHPLTDAALRQIRQDGRAREPRDWVVRLTRGVRAMVLDRLVETGMLRRDTDRLLKIFPRTRYPAPGGLESPVETQARRRMRDAVTGSEPVDPSTAVLCALVGAMGWAWRVLPDLPRREVDTRFDEIRRSVWAADAVRMVIDDARAASTAGTAAAAATA